MNNIHFMEQEIIASMISKNLLYTDIIIVKLTPT